MKSIDTRGTLVGAIGGLATGYVLWLVAYSIGDDTTRVGQWSPIVLMLSGVLAVCAGVWGWRLRRRGERLWASFAFGLPILPVILTLAVLADILL
ncbi:MAG: hypothetical protein WBZ37_09025 [Mycobacterium sp.]